MTVTVTVTEVEVGLDIVVGIVATVDRTPSKRKKKVVMIMMKMKEVVEEQKTRRHNLVVQVQRIRPAEALLDNSQGEWEHLVRFEHHIHYRYQRTEPLLHHLVVAGIDRMPTQVSLVDIACQEVEGVNQE